MSSYHCRFDDKDRTAASGFYDVADRLLTFQEMHQSSKSCSGVSLPPKNAPLLGAIYPQKRCTFANVVGSYAINVPPTCLQSRPTHPVKSAFYTILLRFSWAIGVCERSDPFIEFPVRPSKAKGIALAMPYERGYSLKVVSYDI